MRAVRLTPSPADLLPGLTAGVSEVSRFSCMKFLDVPWGLRPRRTEPELAFIAPVHIAFRAFIPRRRPGCMPSD